MPKLGLHTTGDTFRCSCDLPAGLSVPRAVGGRAELTSQQLTLHAGWHLPAVRASAERGRYRVPIQAPDRHRRAASPLCNPEQSFGRLRGDFPALRASPDRPPDRSQPLP
jgi:hypothetical protein